MTKKHITHEFGAASAVAPYELLDVASHQIATTQEYTQTEAGTYLVNGLRIFKSGTFKDSKGIERTWERSHLEQMVYHMNLLATAGLFKDVPMRSDHSKSVKDVVGYIKKVYLDPSDPTYLLGDVEFTEADAFQKWNRGTWRSRSLEVGMYETNDGALFWPVVMGLAWVDIGAVEGLHSRHDGQTVSQTVVDYAKENDVDPAEWERAANYAQALQDWEAAVTYAAWVEAAEYAQALADWEAAAVYAQALQDQMVGATPPGDDADHQRPPALATFRVNGGETQDFMAVQAHIDALEGFARETREANRADFVRSLVTDNKIAAPQGDAMTNLVQTMTDEQFEAFRASYADAPSLALFQQHGQQDGGTPPPSGDEVTPLSEIEAAKEIVAQHRRSGMAAEKLYRTPSFRTLVKHGVEANPSTDN